MLQQKDEASSTQSPSEALLANRLILVTNRGPVEYDIGQDKKLRRRRGAGGVVTALTEAISRIDTTWVALGMTEGDRQAIQESGNGLLPPPPGKQNMHLRYVAVPKRVYHEHYNVISNQVLWFLQHYLDHHENTPSSSEKIRKAWEDGYVRTNQALADAVTTEIERGEGSVVVMLHDYHLYLISSMIREHNPSVTMQQFIHIPWPEVRYWQSALPAAIIEAIFHGLLGNDIIGLQTRRDAQNFIEGVATLFNDMEIDTESGTITHEGRRTLVRDYPISISVTDELRTVRSRAGKRATERIMPLLGKQTIMRVDRIEPTKNIIQGFQAYAYLLEHHFELQEQVKFLAFLVPSRQTVAAYRRHQQDILKLIEEINQQYGKNGWMPIEVFVQNDRTTALAAMQFYDALLVNSLFDGMNLVAKEGAVVNKRDGVLVLSRTSGAFQQLESASIPISPGDTVETAEALHTALTLPPEERKRLSTLAREEVERDDLRSWIARQIGDINSVIESKNRAT
jgi:trehalose 6-phosphate synthase